VQGLRVWASPESTRLVFDLSQEAKYKLFTLENPYRVVIDIEDAQYKANFDQKTLADSKIIKLRHAQREKGLRLVLDMEEKVKPSSFMLAPNQTYGHRLVVDLNLSQTKISSTTNTINIKHPIDENSQKVTAETKYTTREFIVAIDPGHGGDDTGAIGLHHQLREKDVVLSVSKKLQALINAQPGMKAFLVRNGDYYVGLRSRMGVARDKGADLFISVHADSFKDNRASGASVYVLSEKGASNEAARWLAERENRSDLIGGVKLEDKGDLLASVLLDLSQTASQSASHELGNHLIANLAKVTDLHHKTVQRAGFMVLKSPDIPSVLVELGFISNQNQEKKLLNAAHQQALATALLAGVKAYAARRPAPVKHQDDWTVAKK
jgi:N-acetylmuramoyl-L-alanine amidase